MLICVNLIKFTYKKELKMDDVYLENLIKSPCVFCGYNGPGYYQTAAHKTVCPFYKIGGNLSRENYLKFIIPTLLKNYYINKTKVSK